MSHDSDELVSSSVKMTSHRQVLSRRYLIRVNISYHYQRFQTGRFTAD